MRCCPCCACCSGPRSGGSTEGLGLDNQPPSAISSMPLGFEGAVGAAGLRRWRMAGLGFGLPLSRLYARYFGELRARAGSYRGLWGGGRW
jgi:hypothetical protein